MERGAVSCERLLPSLLLVDLSLRHVDVALTVGLKAVHSFGKCSYLTQEARRLFPEFKARTAMSYYALPHTIH
jgi:hypothetical protein